MMVQSSSREIRSRCWIPSALFCGALTDVFASQNWYLGDDRSMLIPNTLFRMGGAAMILTNRLTEYARAKYELQHVVRVHLGADDMAYEYSLCPSYFLCMSLHHAKFGCVSRLSVRGLHALGSWQDDLEVRLLLLMNVCILPLNFGRLREHVGRAKSLCSDMLTSSQCQGRPFGLKCCHRCRMPGGDASEDSTLNVFSTKNLA